MEHPIFKLSDHDHILVDKEDLPKDLKTIRIHMEEGVFKYGYSPSEDVVYVLGHEKNKRKRRTIYGQGNS